MAKMKRKAARSPDAAEVRGDVEEEARIEGHWRIVGPGGPTERPKGKHRSIDELVRLQFELIKLQE